jgi:ATP/maltotriose-dependent transcriptional regulator MalT
MLAYSVGLGESALAVVQSPERFSTEQVLTLLINDLAVYAECVVLVLDDSHMM